MATGIVKSNSVVGLAAEVTEGTWVTPSDWVLPLDGFSSTPAKELLERQVITGGLQRPTPRTGLKSVAASLPLEYKASGTEGAAPESDLLLKGLLGAQRQITTQTTTKGAGQTTSTLPIEDADIGDFTVGDFIIILESADHTTHFVTAVDATGGSANITYAPVRGGAPSASVVVSKSTTYYPATTGEAPISASIYWADEILEKVIGCRVTSMSLDNYTVGQLASMNFSLQGLNFDRIDGASSSPTYDTGLPPVLLEACIYKDGISLPVNTLSLTVDNEIGQISSLCSEAGVTSQRRTRRNISGSINPYTDDTDVTRFDEFVANTEYSLIAFARTPSSVSGEIELGTACGIYLPQCITTEIPVDNLDDVLVDNITFQASGGSDGTSQDIFIGFV